jgi:hypothetical protein
MIWNPLKKLNKKTSKKSQQKVTEKMEFLFYYFCV